MAGRTKGRCICGNLQTSTGLINGRRYYSRYCSSCKKSKDRRKVKVSLVCALCGFQAKHSAQLDIDHRDGNHANNDLENLQVICANCHRLKTIEEKDYLNFEGVMQPRTANKWVGRRARQYLRSIGFTVADRGAYTKEMLEALEKAGIPKGRHFYLSKGDEVSFKKMLAQQKARKKKKK
jgi:5-methylcytosine-specific restriction endonuclease McrA